MIKTEIIPQLMSTNFRLGHRRQEIRIRLPLVFLKF